MKQTVLTIIISVVTTLVAFNFLSKDSGDKLIDVAEEVLQVQEASVDTGATNTGSINSGLTISDILDD